MTREQIIRKIEVKAGIVYGKEHENVKVCIRGKIYPKCFVGSVDKYGSCTKQLSPEFLPTMLLAYVQGVQDGLDLALQRMINN